MSSGNGSGRAMAEINVTPLVDVMLVLLIIFMVTAPMMNPDIGVEVDLPNAEAPPLDESTDQQLVLMLHADLSVSIKDNQFSLDELEPKLRAIRAANPDQDVFVRADGAVPYEKVAGLLGIARSSGIPKVGLVFEPLEDETSP
ncbi:MAG: ExbD/TolR family protein [Myxococcota bacterium]